MPNDGSWLPGKFQIASGDRAKLVEGWKLNGLGLRYFLEPTSDFFPYGVAAIYHLGSGHLLCLVNPRTDRLFDLAGELAKAGDWTFHSLDGWTNQFPAAWKTLIGFIDANPEVSRPKAGQQNEEVARLIATRGG